MSNPPADVLAFPPIQEFALDVALHVVARVRAPSLDAARSALAEFDSVSLNVQHDPVLITEASVINPLAASLFETTEIPQEPR